MLDLPPAAVQINRRFSRTLAPCLQLFSRFVKERSRVRRPSNGGNNSQDNPIITWKELAGFSFNNLSSSLIFMDFRRNRSSQDPSEFSSRYTGYEKWAHRCISYGIYWLGPSIFNFIQHNMKCNIMKKKETIHWKVKIRVNTSCSHCISFFSFTI